MLVTDIAMPVRKLLLSSRLVMLTKRFRAVLIRLDIIILPHVVALISIAMAVVKEEQQRRVVKLHSSVVFYLVTSTQQSRVVLTL